jgi:replicative DNA helicase
MAKKNDKNKFTDRFLEISKKVNKQITEYGSTLDSSIYSNIDEYIDTGSYSLNRLITGSIYNGIPRGRVIALAGQSGTFKSVIMSMIARNAQLLGYNIIFYDSENAIDKDFMSRLGADTERILYFPIDTMEDVRNHAINTTKEFLSENPDEKIMLMLDSFGNLSCAKELRDLESGKDNTDMGCFVPDTLIKVNGGQKKIQDIKEGDTVITHLNRERKVTKLFKYENKRQKYKFMIGDDVLEVTPQHKLLVYGFDEKEFVWKQAKDISQKDKLVKMKK